MTEIYKSISQIDAQFMWTYLIYKELPYNLRKASILNLPKIKSTYYDTNDLHFDLGNFDME